MPQVFAEVAVNSTLPHRQTFSYAVPYGLNVNIGSAVHVPFGRKVLQGIVVEIHEIPVFSEPEKIRPIISTVGDRPLVDEAHVRLALWMSDYYLATIFDSVNLMLPPGFEQKPITFVRPLIDADEVAVHDLPPRQLEVMAIVTRVDRIRADELREKVSFSTVDAIVAQLERRNLLRREYQLGRPRVSGRTVTIVALAVPATEAHDTVDRVEPPRTSRRAVLLERLVEKKRVSDDEAIRLTGGRARLQALISSGAVRSDREGHGIELGVSPAEALEEILALRLTARARQAHRAIDTLTGGDQLASELRAAGIETATLDRLVSLGVVRTREESVARDPLAHQEVERRVAPTLLPAQSTAAGEIAHAIDACRQETFLLHGVTGSGKTEVYLQALAHCIARGRRAIVLVPEIALTAQTVRRFRERFDRVALLHSGLTDGERFDQWHGIAHGEYDVVIGSRSALFAPQPDLGLIVIDEEHEWTYKQHEVPPRYHARDAAIELARECSAVVVLGSATPGVESYERARRGAYTYLSLPERVRPVSSDGAADRLQSTAAMPQIDVVDLREELHAGNRNMFSRALHDAIAQSLDSHEQTILFLNRRGLAGHVQCRDCGFVPECSSCYVALTYHRSDDRLVCHQCNRRVRLRATCGQCGSPRVRLVGAGVEKVEAEAMRAFPGARVLRWDRDVTRGRHAHEQILSRFLRHEADILVGTQMLAKGLDLPAVTVVGIVNADIGLHLPDFRAPERTFQIITQVAGRAGRGERPGRVIVQTYQPDHLAIDSASRYDFDGFVAAELSSRRDHAYPPFGRLLRLSFGHTNPRYAREETMRLQRALSLRRAELGLSVDIIGPSPAYVPRVRGRWRWHLLVRGSDPTPLVRDYLLPAGWSVDVDPVTLA